MRENASFSRILGDAPRHACCYAAPLDMVTCALGADYSIANATERCVLLTRESFRN
jgi:hypothetical protein